jgi:hypothetical protein
MAEHQDTPQEPAIETGAAPTAAVVDLSAVTATKTEQPHSRSHRFALLAASVALAAAFGGVIGSFGLTAAARLLPEPAKAAAVDETPALKNSIAELAAELGALKASIEAASKGASSQFSRISERVERAERAHGEPAARLAKIAESLDRLERRVTAAPAAPPALAATAAPAPAATAAPAPAATAAPVPETTGSTSSASADSKAPADNKAPAESKEAAKPGIVTGWIIRDVYGGRIALLENRYGIYEVEPGSNVPGVGRVESIKRQDGRWVVVTPKGLITSYR